MSEYNKKYFAENKEKIKEKRKIYYEANKEKIKAQMKDYRKAQKEKVTVWKKIYIELNSPSEMDLLRSIILKKTGIDVKNNKRKRDVVDIKRIFSTIARRTRTYRDIADFLGKNHATIIHHIKTCDDLRLTDKEFNQKYLTIENILKS